jgi:bis(5'-nucleosyl)-tetraphosphatase (symmetrical)
MARYAIGDLQGCYSELRELLAKLRFKSDRDLLWFAGDLVNRGPESLQALRFVHDLGANAITVLGNHDLHLLAQWRNAGSCAKKKDTLEEILAAPDRDVLLHWLAARPLLHHEPVTGDLLVHAGIVPQWSAQRARALAREVETALAHDLDGVLARMYGDKPDQFDDSLQGADRVRFIVNACTRMRLCTAKGRIDPKFKGAPDEAVAPWAPWFTHPAAWKADTRVVFGHWSALGFHDDGAALCLDSGCVWGGALTAINLDERDTVHPVTIACRAHQGVD